MSELPAEEQYAKAVKNYANGKYEKAAKWYRKAADQGFAEAQFDLGLMYAYGLGVTQSYPKAAKWWRKAAEQGYAMAQRMLERLEACK